MALSTVVFVGDAKQWLPELVERAQKLKVSSGFEENADLGPMITQQVFSYKKSSMLLPKK